MDSVERPLLELVRARRAELERNEGETFRQILIAFESMRSNEIEAVLQKILEDICVAGHAPSAVLAQALQIVDRKGADAPGHMQSVQSGVTEAALTEEALLKVLADHGITVSDGDATAPQ